MIMSNIDHNAKSYGDALFMLAEELGHTEQVKADLTVVCATVKQNPDYLKLLDTPAIPCEERVALVEGAFGKLNRNLVNLIKILCEKRCAYLINKIEIAFSAAYDQSRGIERVEAISTIPLTDAQIAKLRAKLMRLTGKQIIVNNTIDPTILGGMKLRYLGVQIDGSIKTKLDAFEKSLKDLVI